MMLDQTVVQVGQCQCMLPPLRGATAPPWIAPTTTSPSILIFLKILDFLFQSELRFVATVTTGGCVKFVPAVYIFPENNAISRIICVELKDLHTPSVILH